MAQNNESTTKFKADISELKAAFQEAQRAVRVANSEFKAATAGMDDWSNTADGLSAKLKQLNSVLDSEKAKLANLEDQYRLVAKEQGENSTGAENLKIRINNQRAAVASAESQLNKYTDALNNLSSESTKTESAVDKLENTISDQESELSDLKREYANLTLKQGESSSAAKDVAKHIEDLSGELKDNKSKLEEAIDAADSFDESLDDVDDSSGIVTNGFTVMKGALANLVAEGISRAVDGLKDFAKNMVATAATIKAENAQFEQTFGDLGDEASAAINRVGDSAGILETRLKTTGTGIYAFAKASGMDSAEALSMMEEALTVTADSAAYYDKSLEDTAESLQSFLKGNFANDAALGVSCTETTRNAAANKLYGESFKDLSESQKQLALLQMVKDANELSGAMGQAARESDGWENVTGNLSETWRQFQANVGTSVLEQLTPIIQKITSAFQDWVNDVDWDAIGQKVADVFGAFKNLIGWVINNKDAVIAGIVGIGTAFLAFKVVGIIQAATTAIQGMTAAQAALHLVMNLNPIGLIVAAIAGLVAAFVVLWNKSDAFRNFWIGIWENIKNAVNAVIDWLKNNWKTLILFLMNPIAGLFKYFYDHFEGFRNVVDNVMNSVKGFFINAWDAIKNAFSSAGDFFSNVWESVKKPFTTVADWFKDTFSKAWQNVKDVFSGIGDFFGGLWDTIKNKFTDLGTKLGDAIGGAVKSGLNGILAFIEDTVNNALSMINNALSLINKIPGVEIGKFDMLELPRLAKGGIINKATTAVIGEDGREAVVPLENNTGWLDAIAAKLANKLGAFNLNVGGQINPNVVNNFYQTNHSPKALSRLEIYRQSKNLLTMKGV